MFQANRLTADRDLELLRRRKLLEMQRANLLKETKEKSVDKPDTRAILDGVFVGRAPEIWETAAQQFPTVMANLGEVLARLIASGDLKGPISGEQLYWLLGRLGLRVRLKTAIRVLESGELKTIAEKLSEK